MAKSSTTSGNSNSIRFRVFLLSTLKVTLSYPVTTSWRNSSHKTDIANPATGDTAIKAMRNLICDLPIERSVEQIPLGQPATSRSTLLRSLRHQREESKFQYPLKMPELCWAVLKGSPIESKEQRPPQPRSSSPIPISLESLHAPR